MKDRLRVREVVVVEGKYDASTVQDLIDGLVLTTDGFSIFIDDEKKELLRRLGRERGLLVLTDSDAAGFAIRHHIEKIAGGCEIKHAYIPAVAGKEARKSRPSKEGTLGVEGLPQEVLLEALARAGVTPAAARKGRPITYTDLYEMGISGGAGSAEKRRSLLQRLGLPPRLSKKALVEVLSTLYSYEEFTALLEDKPALFWDFHATLSLPDVAWFDAAMAALETAVPEAAVSRQTLEAHFSRTCLPWWEIGLDTRRVKGPAAWWAFCEERFIEMLAKCGLDKKQAERCAPLFREYIIDPAHYALYPDAITTLQKLQRRGYRSYVLSNNFPELPLVLEGLGLAPYLSGVVVSGEIGYEKPHPGIFEAAREMAGGSEFWMIGDNPTDDIEGAKAAGFTTVAVHGAQSPAADYCIGELSEILELL